MKSKLRRCKIRRRESQGGQAAEARRKNVSRREIANSIHTDLSDKRHTDSL